jgi:hypothetical protein
MKGSVDRDGGREDGREVLREEIRGLGYYRHFPWSMVDRYTDIVNVEMRVRYSYCRIK